MKKILSLICLFLLFACANELDKPASAEISQIPQFILISTEVMGYRGSNHAADASAYKAVMEKDKFIVDYVRVFDEIS
jgi:hypothetical protein